MSEIPRSAYKSLNASDGSRSCPHFGLPRNTSMEVTVTAKSSVRSVPAFRKDIFWISSVLVLALLALALIGTSAVQFIYGDVLEYRAVFDGRWHEAHEPFADRILVPLLGRAVNGISGIDPWIALALVNVGFYALFLLALNRLLIAFGVIDSRLRVLILASPIFLYWSRSVALPDIAYNALVAAGLWAFVRRRWTTLVGLVVVMTLTKEVAVLFTLPAVLLLARRQPRVALALGIACFASLGLAQWIARQSPGNLHGVHPLLYPILKVAFHGPENLLGLKLAFPGRPGQEDIWFKIDLPNIGALGRIDWIGVDTWRPHPHSQLALGLLGAFGMFTLAPFTRDFWRRLWRTEEHVLFVRFVLIYGVLMVVSNLLGGILIERVLGYAWPLFLLLGVFWLSQTRIALDGRWVALHLAMTWGVHLVLYWFGVAASPWLILLTYAVLLVPGVLWFRTARAAA